jgi:hypothetical protein
LNGPLLRGSRSKGTGYAVTRKWSFIAMLPFAHASSILYSRTNHSPPQLSMRKERFDARGDLVR